MNYVVVDKEKLESDLTIVADSIRAKANVTEKIEFPSEYKSVVESIDTSKPEQEKTISITENGTTEVTPDEGKVLSKVTVNVEVESGGGSGSSGELITMTSSCANAVTMCELLSSLVVNGEKCAVFKFKGVPSIHNQVVASVVSRKSNNLEEGYNFTLNRWRTEYGGIVSPVLQNLTNVYDAIINVGDVYEKEVLL